MVRASPLTIIKVSTSQTDLTTTSGSRTLSAKLTTSSTTVTPSMVCIFLETIGARSRTFLSCILDPNSTQLEDFLAGFPFKATVEVGDPTLQLHNWAYAAFLQDDWRL